jgi:hypothetical protein
MDGPRSAQNTRKKLPSPLWTAFRQAERPDLRGHFPAPIGKERCFRRRLEAYLMILLQRKGRRSSKHHPTWKPQIAERDAQVGKRVLAKNVITIGRWVKESGYIYRIGMARIFFLSGGPSSNVVGATADTLLECDEAQDVLIHKWDKDFAPMAASTNATRVFWGTCWTSKTLLARERRAAEEAQSEGWSAPRICTRC